MEVLADRFRAMRSMGLRHPSPQGRRNVYNALGMTAHADEHDPGLNRHLPTLHKGFVRAGHPRRATPSPRGSRGPSR